jgi:peptide/nickel transport system permease protein
MSAPATPPADIGVRASSAWEVAQQGRKGPFQLYARAIVNDKVTLVAMLFLVVLLFSAVFAPLVSPFEPEAQSLMLRNQPPMTEDAAGGSIPHLLGTDQLGRDLLTRLLYGARISLAVGFAGAMFSGAVGVVLGLVAGFYRGIVDDIIMRLVDTQMGFPSLMTALLVLYVLGPGMWKVILVLAVTRWMVYARITRSLVLSLREEVFVEAARTVGCSDRRILFRHILPNLLSPILVLLTLEVATMILTEASLSFLGLGIQPPDSSWGLMLAQGRAYITSAWWLVTFPGLIILITALSLNLVATWARAVTDPVTRWRYLGGARASTPQE